MKLAFKDFVPRQLRAPHFGISASAIQGEYESLEDVLAAANAWLSGSSVRVTHVETVVLPNLGADWERGSTDPVLGSPSSSPLWHQFIRIWYDEEPAG